MEQDDGTYDDIQATQSRVRLFKEENYQELAGYSFIGQDNATDHIARGEECRTIKSLEWQVRRIKGAGSRLTLVQESLLLTVRQSRQFGS